MMAINLQVGTRERSRPSHTTRGPASVSSFEHDPVKREAILTERARILASRRTRTESRKAGVMGLVFVAGIERFALPLSTIAAAVRGRALGLVPGARQELLGTLYERGVIWSIFDPCALLARPRARTASDGIILLLRDPRRIGLRIDAVERMERMDLARLSPLVAAESATTRTLVRGATADAIIVLDESRSWRHPAIMEER